jgi:hypothetical protein
MKEAIFIVVPRPMVEVQSLQRPMNTRDITLGQGSAELTKINSF